MIFQLFIILSFDLHSIRCIFYDLLNKFIGNIWIRPYFYAVAAAPLAPGLESNGKFRQDVYIVNIFTILMLNKISHLNIIVMVNNLFRYLYKLR